MNFITPPFSNNELLSMLPSDELILLRPLLTKVQLVKGQILHEAGERIEQMFFVQQGFVLMVAEADGNNPSNEVGLIGREGMVGLPVLLHPQAVSFNRTMVQVPGAAHRLPAQVLHEYAYALPVLRRLLSEALQMFMAQVAQAAACNGQHSLAQRLTRWLLMAHDRMDGDKLVFTQEFLGIMLAVQRVGVRNALRSLHAAGLVDQRRGRITIRDRPGLEAAACGCYGRVQAFAAIVTARMPGTPDPADLAA